MNLRKNRVSLGSAGWKKYLLKTNCIYYVFNSSTWNVEVGESLGILGQSGLYGMS